MADKKNEDVQVEAPPEDSGVGQRQVKRTSERSDKDVKADLTHPQDAEPPAEAA